MQRRTLLFGIGGSSLVMAGCLDSIALHTGNEPARPTELVSFTFETGVNTEHSQRESGPRITADQDGSRQPFEEQAMAEFL